MKTSLYSSKILYRLDGCMIAENKPQKYNCIKTIDPVQPVDRRRGKLKVRERFKLTKFEIDANFCGKLPNTILTLSGLSTTMKKIELEDALYQLYREENIEKVSLYNPPQTPFPTGLAKIIFKDARKCTQAQQYLNKKSIWHSFCINASFDPKAEWLKFLFEQITQKKMRPENVPSKEDFDMQNYKKARDIERQKKKERKKKEKSQETIKTPPRRTSFESKTPEIYEPSEQVPRTPSPLPQPEYLGLNEDFDRKRFSKRAEFLNEITEDQNEIAQREYERKLRVCQRQRAQCNNEVVSSLGVYVKFLEIICIFELEYMLIF